MSVVKNNSQSYVNPRVLPGQLLASGRSRSSRDYQSAIKSKFELEYIDASGNIKKENTFVYAIYQMARSSISASDKVKGINLLLEKERMEGKVLEDAEIAFIGKARSFISEVKASSVLRQKDAKLFHWVNTFVVQRPIKAKPTLYFPSLPNWLATPARVVAVAVAVAATALTLIALSGIENKAFAAITLQTPSNKISNAKVNHIVELKSPVYYAAASAGAMATVKPVSLKSSMLLADNQPSASSSVNTNFSTSQPASAATDADGPTIADASNFSITGLDVGIIGSGPSKTTPPTLVGNGPGAFLTPGTSQSVGNERAYSATVANFGAQSLSLFAGNSRFSSLQENSADVALDYSNTNYLNSNYYGAVRTDENIMGGQSLSAGLLIKQQTPLKRLSILADVSYLPTVTTFNVPGPNVTELVGNGPGAFLTSVPSIIAATNITHSVNYGIGGEYKLTEANSIFGSFADVYGKDFYSAGYKFESGSDLFGLRVDYTSGSDPIPSAYVAGKTFMGKVSYSPSTSELSGFGEYALWGTVIPSFETSQPLGRDLEAPVGTVFGSDLTFASRKPAWVDLEPAQRFAVGVSGSISDDLNGSGMQSYYADVAAKLKISKRVEVGIDAFTSKDTGINGVHDQQEGFGGEVQYNFGKVQAGIGGGVTSEGGFIEAMLRF